MNQRNGKFPKIYETLTLPGRVWGVINREGWGDYFSKKMIATWHEVDRVGMRSWSVNQGRLRLSERS